MLSAKRYQCDRCGCIIVQTTNHYGKTWSFGRFNTCPDCPPWAKYGEFGGLTTWTCLDSPSLSDKDSDNGTSIPSN